MTKAQFILELLREGRHWVEILLPALIAWHLKRPMWIRRGDDE